MILSFPALSPRAVRVLAFTWVGLALVPFARAAETSRPADFALVGNGSAAPFLIEAETVPAVARAAADVRSDLERVTGVRPSVLQQVPSPAPHAVVIAGVVGHSPTIDALVAAGKLDARKLKGAWESFSISVVAHPLPGVDQGLIIAGSDRRGAIYGLYEISNLAGVSPWAWWADVAPAKKATVSIAAGTTQFGPPSVKYRGVFINDEDWALLPWAARNFDPETGNIGSKTYAKVFELLLRLRANTLWPAMHEVSRPFNFYPQNKELADAYGIIMGSSHAEPMLRNNVGEWTEPKDQYNYLSNRAGVLSYWEQRVRDNGRYENIYTLGMRGIHDSHMQGPRTDPERIQTLERIFADQRALLQRYVAPNVTEVPQMFCAYKEVLQLYRQGLRVPEDVTIVWPDDNFGYIRNFATPAERIRPGGFGVYYHLSYLGAPLSYLWLCTTPPALVWEEMHKAYEHGADRIWIANIGDIKPAEYATEFFLQMAWDIHRWQPNNLPRYLPEVLARDFGSATAETMASLLEDYYVLNFQRKPEHLQWWLPGKPRRPSALTDDEVASRLKDFARLKQRATELREKIPASLQDAYYQLIYYPIVGSALANERFLEGERGNIPAARTADRQLADETRFFNEKLSAGKWRGLMALEPADGQWKSMRIEPWSPPETPRAPVASSAAGTFLSFDAAHFTHHESRGTLAWTVVPGLGRTGSAITVLPSTFEPIAREQIKKRAPRIDYTATFPASGEFALQLYFLPTHALTGSALRVALSLDDQTPAVVALEVDDGGPGWSQGVLDAVRVATTSINVEQPGQHVLRVYGIDPGVVLDKIVIDLGGLKPSYLGPR